ncbi:MAG: FCD domain-containing protein [Bacillota bacterium]|uniref:FCD domain-containing protein n=1 Tax=Thermanaerosceptrum fracticalcis TaxID=1712410 RepID=A0A7G6E687_THEFR|nr:FCD domain-containing protein [Thermanaerosceptrum fracticalcis]QNB47591.1 FCD domain-containing protein [Thermanaerosceptrum fracticalcis]
MLAEKDRQDYLTLFIIGQSESPVGSGYLSRELKTYGWDVSEATAGRILAQLDNLGYTTKVGYQGRTLTALGHAKLKELEDKKLRADQGLEFFRVLESRTKEELIDILVARRAIERELARLAAIHATDEEIKELWHIQRLQKERVAHWKGGAAEQDVAFHRIIARASRNKVLQGAMELIRQDGQLAPVLEYIRKEVHSVVSADHAKIVTAIEAHNPDLAEQYMQEHIENLIKDVNKYWDEVENR